MEIPRKIFQTWKTKELSGGMAANRKLLIKRTPGFEHILFDDSDCREFLAKHFKPPVLLAYDRLIPGAFKADLWRYCVMYIEGGIYMDIKLNFVEGFNAERLLEREHYPLDVPLNRKTPFLEALHQGKREPKVQGIYQAFLVCRKGSDIMRQAVFRCVRNVLNRKYGRNILSVSGPCFLYDVIKDVKPSELSNQVLTSKKNHERSELGIVDHYIMIDNTKIVYPYEGYRYELCAQASSSYAKQWLSRAIYK